MTLNRLALADEDGGILEVELSKGQEGAARQEENEAADNPVVKKALEVGVLCNNASLHGQNHDGESEAIGDPLEVALLEAGAAAGLDREELLESYPEAREEAFDPETKMMATFHRRNGSWRVAVKGAPEAVLEACGRVKAHGQTKSFGESDKSAWREANRRLAGDGLRMLALAEKDAASPNENPYENLTWLGLAGLLDPSREEVAEAISKCQKAGIRVVMGTGDQPETARHIAEDVGLIEDEQSKVILGSDLPDPEDLSAEEQQRLLQAQIFARVSPKQKLDLIALHQEHGSIMAMTGDGVNDAPGLKKADIGIAMGQRGTQVAREAADMILKDDAFGTIVAAIEYGRAIFGNIRKFILFLLSGNVSEILIVALAWLAGAPLPLWPLQILYLNMIGDVFPALALGVGECFRPWLWGWGRGTPRSWTGPPVIPRNPF